MIERVFGVVVTTEVGPLDEAVEGLGAVDIEGLDGLRAADVLVELRRVRAKLAAVEARLVARVDGERPWAEAGYLGTAAWLAASDHTSLDEARGDVRLARRLGSMPATAAALAAGDITVAHARRLATLNAPDTAAAFGEAEEFLVGQARSMRWADFTKACGYWLRQARRDKDPDPDKPDRDHRKRVTPRRAAGHRAAVRGAHPHRQGRGPLRARPARTAAVRGRLGRGQGRARRGGDRRPPGPHPGPAPPRRPGRDGPPLRHRPRDGKRPKPLLTVLVGEDAFRNVLEVADGTLISPATAADLLDEAVIETMLFDSPSRVLDLGHQRSFVGAARRAVEVVHRTCTGKGCHIRSDAVRDRPHPPLGSPAAPPCPRTAGPNAGPTIDNTTGPPQPHSDHHPTPTTAATVSPAPPPSNSPGPASATASSTTPPGAPSPTHVTTTTGRPRASFSD